MGILQDIIAEATSSGSDAPRLLRLCMVLGSRLPHEPLKTWARFELEGYPIDVDVPAYRGLKVKNMGQFLGHNFDATLEISTTLLPEALRPSYERAYFRESIAECADLAAKAAKGGRFQVAWPVELAIKFGSKHLSHGQCHRAWMEVSPSELVAIVDVVKTKVLAFALEIEGAAPHAGDVPGTSAPMAPAAVSHIFQTTITNSDIQNLALGNDSVIQTAVYEVTVGDAASLRKALGALCIPDADIASLEVAVKDDKAAAEPSMGQRAKAWLGELAIKAASKGAEAGAENGVKLATKAVLRFLGLDID